MQKLTPNQIVARFIKSRGRKLKNLAHDMEIPASTLSRSLKNLGSTKYDSAFAIRLAKSLQVPISSLEEACKNGEDLRPDVYHSLIEHQISFFRPKSSGYMKEILDVTKRLRQGDWYTLVTCYVPLECYDRELSRTISEAIRMGVTFCYIFPDPKTSSDDSRDYDKIIEPYLTSDTRGWKEIVDEFNKRFMDWLDKDCGLPQEVIKSRVIVRFSSDPILISPFSKFILISRQILGTLDFTVFCEARIGTPNDSRPLPYWYPMSRVDAQKIEERIHKVIEEGKDTKDE